MASPFSVFRKNQKVMMATLIGLAMFAFIVLPNLDLGGGGGVGGRANPVVVEWDYGDIRDAEMVHMVRGRGILQAFLTEAAQLGVYSSQLMPGAELVIDPRTPVDAQNTVQTLVLAKEAEEMGFVVSDGAINQYLKRLTNNSVDAAQLRGIIEGRQLGGRLVTINMVFEVLRTELLAQQLLRTYVSAAQDVTPAERWESWKRWNDFVTIESLPIEVESFVDKVEPPTEDDLIAFFDTYKDRVQSPEFISGVLLESPLPGFRVPRKVALHYVKADYDDFVDRVAEAITDEEITKYYDDNKDRFFVRTTLFDEPAPKEETDDAQALEQDETQPNSDGDQASQQDDDARPADTTPIDETPVDETPVDEKPVDEKPGDEKPGDETPVDETSVEETPESGGGGGQQPSSPDPGDGTSNQRGRVRLVLASYQEESGGSQDESTQVEVTTESEQGSAPDVEAQAPNSDSTAANTDDNQADDNQADPADAGTAEVDDSQSAVPEQEEPSSEPKDDSRKYTPLDEVEDEIRNTLAGQRAAERMEEVLGSLRPAMRDYAERLSVWEVTSDDPEQGTDAPPRPEPPDMKAMAQEQGLAFEETDLHSYYELDELEVGKSVGVLDGVRLSYKAFATRLPEYRAEMTKDFDGNHRYLAWVVEATPQVDVTLEEVRPEVERAWKMHQARQLARDEADRLKGQVIDSGQTLRQFFPAKAGDPVADDPVADDPAPDDPVADDAVADDAVADDAVADDLAPDSPAEAGGLVTESDPFSWLTIGATPLGGSISLRLSEVAGIDGAGLDFMQAVFDLKVADVGVAMNHSQTTAYVVRVVSRRRTLLQLQDTFLLTSSPSVNQVQQVNSRSIFSSLIRELVVASNLRWVEGPNSLQPAE